MRRVLRWIRLLYAIVPAISYRLLGCLQAYGSCNLVMVGAGQVWAVGTGLHMPGSPDRRIRTIIVEMGLEGSLKIVVIRPVRRVVRIVEGFWSFGMPPGGREKDNREREDNDLV